MRRPVIRAIARTTLAVAILGLMPGHGTTQAQAQGGQPPHAWLFGTWTGGLFPAPSDISAEACLAQPVVIFTRDVVLRATLTEATYAQRVVATVRATSDGFEFGLAPGAGGGPTDSLFFGEPRQIGAAGFGCETADVLHVERHGQNEIAFPGCADFPNPLVRCPTR